MRRFFIAPEQFEKDHPMVTGPDVHHLRDVLRMRSGDEIQVFDGRGHVHRARIVALERDRVRLEWMAPVASDKESPLSLTVAAAMLKDKKMDRLVRQLTELGVTRWSPYFAGRSVPAPVPERVDARVQRWRRIALEAVKQCGRGMPMRIDPPVDFEKLLTQAKDYGLKLICWERATCNAPIGRQRPAEPGSAILMIGPEGGFTGQEVEQAKEAGFHAVGMGPRILRADTAVLAATVITQSLFGDMDENLLDNAGAV